MMILKERRRRRSRQQKLNKQPVKVYIIPLYGNAFILCIEEYEKLKANVTMLTEEKLQLQDKLEISTSGKTISILIHNLYYLLL